MDNNVLVDDDAECVNETSDFLAVRMAVFAPLGTLVAFVSIVNNALLAYIMVTLLNAARNNLLYLAVLNAFDLLFGEHTAHTGRCTLQGTYLFEIEVTLYPDCPGLGAASFAPPSSGVFSMESPLRRIWTYWTRTIATVFTPFILLVTMHGRLWMHNRSHLRNLLGQHHLHRTMAGKVCSVLCTDCVRTGSKASARMLVAVVVSFLCIHSVNVILSTWEISIWSDTLFSLADGMFYSLATDLSSLLNVRVPIARTHTRMRQCANNRTPANNARCATTTRTTDDQTAHAQFGVVEDGVFADNTQHARHTRTAHRQRWQHTVGPFGRHDLP
ncbi:unnamed protein product [Sphagnum balticum]